MLTIAIYCLFTHLLGITCTSSISSAFDVSYAPSIEVTIYSRYLTEHVQKNYVDSSASVHSKRIELHPFKVIPYSAGSYR